MRLRLETFRLLLYKFVLKMGRLSGVIVASTMEAIHIQDARGYMSEFEVKRDLHDVMGGIIYSGTPDIQRNIIAETVDMETRND